MNKAMFYSLMESNHLLRDCSMLMEAYDPRGYIAKGGKGWHAEQLTHTDPAKAKAAAELPDVIPPERKTPVIKMTKEQLAKVHEDKMAKLRKKYPKHTDVEIAAKRVEEFKHQTSDAPKWYSTDISHRKHPVKLAYHKMKVGVGGALDKASAAASKIAHDVDVHGHLATAAKVGIPAVAGYAAGMAHGGARTMAHVKKMPAYKAAKEWGPWIKKAKKYGPYALAGGAGLLAAHALSSDN